MALENDLIDYDLIPIKPFWKAIRESDIDGLHLTCGNNRLPSFCDKTEEQHILSKAMKQDADTAMLQALVSLGVDPKAMPTGSHYSPLNQALSKRRLDYLDFVLRHDVDPNDNLIRQRVTLAAVGRETDPSLQIQFLQRLIVAGVDLNFIFSLFGDMSKAFTVLDHATDPQVKEFLRSHGAKTAAELGGHGPKAARDEPFLNEIIEYFAEQFGPVEPKSFSQLIGGHGVKLSDATDGHQQW